MNAHANLDQAEAIAQQERRANPLPLDILNHLFGLALAAADGSIPVNPPIQRQSAGCFGYLVRAHCTSAHPIQWQR